MHHDRHSKTTGGSNPKPGVLNVSEVSFILSMAASAARRTSPRLLLATGDSQDTPPWIQNASRNKKHADDEVCFLACGSTRPGTRNPAWKGKEDGVFWLSLDGLLEPVLFVGLEDGRAADRRGAAGGGNASDLQEAIMVQACIPVPTDGSPGSKAFDVDLDNEMGTVSLQWSVHKDECRAE